jgi:Enoyl-CoA hydratase/isomerase
VHGQKTGVDGRMGDHYPRVWKPVIAAVNGWATGAGLYILLASTDIRIASAEHARFKFALLSQGWLGHGPGASLLIKQLRYIHAMRILLTDDPVDAEEALRIGLVNEVVPHAQLMDRAEKIARHIVTLPPVAVRMMKEIVVRFGDLPTDQAWHVQNLINTLLIQTTTDGEEGRRAFNEKRPPNFTGALRRRGEAGRNHRQRMRGDSTTPTAAAIYKNRRARPRGRLTDHGQEALVASATMGPEIDKSALIIVDMQNDFVHPEGGFALRAGDARSRDRHAVSDGHHPPGEASR